MVAQWIWALPLLGLLCSPEVGRAGGDRRPTGFLDRVYKASDGPDSKYVVFIPHDYEAQKAYPTILFLHGSGATGTDGRAPG